MKEIRWTKQCKCGSYIPDEYEECDRCLLKRHNVTWEETEWHGTYPLQTEYLAIEKVVELIRKLENNDEKKK